MVAMIDSLLTVTSDAREKIDGVRTFNDFPEAVLRVRVLAKEGPRFRYEIALEDPRDRAETDLAVEADGLTGIEPRNPLRGKDLGHGIGLVLQMEQASQGGKIA